MTIEDASANEGDAITFTVTLDKAVAGGLTVTPSFTDGTATEGTDYTANTAALSFAGTAGETQTFTVATTKDPDVEDVETFTVSLSVSGTSATVTATDTATGTIHSEVLKFPSDDATVTIADASASEGAPMTFTVTLNKAVSGGLTVTPSFTDGTATKGPDYTENTNALTFAGTTGEIQTFIVATTEDTDVEDVETFTVSLSVSGTSATVTATDTATGTIIDDDDPLSNPPGNRPPEPRGEMPKQILLVGTSATIDSEPYFVDPDGDPLDYEAETEAPDIATAVTSSPPGHHDGKGKGHDDGHRGGV